MSRLGDLLRLRLREAFLSADDPLTRELRRRHFERMLERRSGKDRRSLSGAADAFRRPRPRPLDWEPDGET